MMYCPPKNKCRITYVVEWSLSLWGNVLFFLLPEREKTLAEVVEAGEQAHAHEHGNIIAHGGAGPGEQVQGKRLGNAIGEHITDRDIERKAHNLRHAVFPIAEGKILIEEKA